MLNCCVFNYNSNNGLGAWIKSKIKEFLNKGISKYYYTKESTSFYRSHSKSVVSKLIMGNILCNIDVDSFWYLTAFLSIMLAVLNLLPIPALDGGHVMFLLYEMVSGRKPGDKFMEYAQMVGFFILIALVLFANGNDIFKAIFN